MNILHTLISRRDRAIRLAAEAMIRGDKKAKETFCAEGNLCIRLISESGDDMAGVER